MAKVSLSQAAKDTGVSLPTLSRWRKRGKITAEKTKNGGYLIDTSEYDRIYSIKQTTPNVKGNMEGNTLGFATPNETNLLQVKVDVLEERLKEKDALLDELRTERNDWKEQAQKLLLQAPQKPPEGDKSIFWWRRTSK